MGRNMKRNNIIIASAISAIPFLFWGVKSVVNNPKFHRIKKDLMNQEKKGIAAAGKVVNKALEPIKEEIKEIVGNEKVKTRSASKRTGGKTIHQGAKGGRYTIGKNGKKLYLKK